MGASEILKRLVISLEMRDAATAQLRTSTDALRSFTGTTKVAEGQLAKMQRRFAQVGRALVSFLIIRTIGVQFTRFIRAMVEGNTVLERATTSMERLGGSLGYARKQIEYIRQTAMRAPFDFQSILGASRLLVAYGRNLQTYLPMLLDWAAALGATSGELEGYAAAMGKIMAGSPYVMRILTTRAVGLDQWKAALEATNTELPKSERYAQALTIALERFEGQATVLARTMAGLKTNIGDVWVEITREVGLSLFARVRSTLFGLYERLRDIADNHRDILYDIGDIFGMWAAKLIVLVRDAGKLRGAFEVVLRLAKHLAVFIIGRTLVMAFVRVGLRIQAAVIALQAMGMVARSVHIALNALSIVAGLIAVHFMRAKMAAIEFRIAVGDLGAAMQIVDDFLDLPGDERIFTREQLAALRAYEQGVELVSNALYKTTGMMDKLNSGQSRLTITAEDWAVAWAEITNQLPFDTDMIKYVRDFADAYEGSMERALGDEAWAERVGIALNALDEMRAAAEEGLPVDAGRWRAEVLKVITAMGELGPIMDMWRENSVVLMALSEETGANYETQETALNNIEMILKGYEAHKLGILEATEQQLTAEQAILEIRAEAAGLVDPRLDLSGWITLYRAVAKIEADLAKSEADRVKRLHDVHEQTMDLLKYTLQMADLEYQRTNNAREYARELGNAIGFLETLLKEGWDEQTTEQVRAVNILLGQLKVTLGDLVAVEEELAFSTGAAFSLWSQALNPIVSAFSSIIDGAKAAGEAFANAFKQMIKWAIQLAAQLAVIAILMSILNITSGGMTGFGGALSALLGGGLDPGRAGRGFRGPQMATAGYPTITPTERGGGMQSKQTVIQVMGDVLDGEHFLRMVDKANFKLETRKGGR